MMNDWSAHCFAGDAVSRDGLLSESMQQERGIHSAWIQEHSKVCSLDDMPGSRKPCHWKVTSAKSNVTHW